MPLIRCTNVFYKGDYPVTHVAIHVLLMVGLMVLISTDPFRLTSVGDRNVRGPECPRTGMSAKKLSCLIMYKNINNH